MLHFNVIALIKLRTRRKMKDCSILTRFEIGVLSQKSKDWSNHVGIREHRFLRPLAEFRAIQSNLHFSQGGIPAKDSKANTYSNYYRIN